MAPSDQAKLDILRVNPIRGQLEPYDSQTPKGWRYIQTTDTPNELKILLPPGTAAMYEQLLRLENYELTKKQTISWERIMEIRRLKDRMIRKCHKLAKTTMPMTRQASIGETFVFQTFVAPQDFRCKEMEKWFKEQQKRTSSVPPHKPSIAPQPSSSVAIIKHVPAPSSKPAGQRSVTNPESSSRFKQIMYHKPLPIQPSRLVQAERTTSTVLPTEPPTSLFSPPPLPLIILSQRESYGLERSAPDQPPSDPPSPESPLSGSELPPPQVTPSEEPLPEATPRPIITRRPSLKRVSWADDHEIDSQLSKYVSAAREASSSGKWEEVRALYLDQIAGLENLHIQVKEGLQHLRSETDHLQRIEETIRAQREALDSTFQQIDYKQTLLQEKVQEVLTEATDSLARHGVRRDLPPINES